MLQTIREIGIFMIIAQAVVHFAPGRQYEKYIKLISSVIILFLFLRPFGRTAGEQWRNPEAVWERWEKSVELAELSADYAESAEGRVETAVVGRMEKEIRERLNRELAADPCRVKRVELFLKEGAEGAGEEAFFLVRAVMEKQPADGNSIGVEEITLNKPRTEEENMQEDYRLRIAGILGLEEGRVEVEWDG